MIECILTLDYEIYGNGSGRLRDLVYEPSETFRVLLERYEVPFVLFVEVAELEMIEREGTDPMIGEVRRQIRAFYEQGIEIGLHVHPWWYNAQYQNGTWILDYSEYNLCSLPDGRIAEIIGRSISHLREILGIADFTPLSFRAGHLLFHPARAMAGVLAYHGLKVDSSVWKGAVWRQHNLDYRAALRNGYYWTFSESSSIPDPQGELLEVPVHTRMVPTWQMMTSKRIGMQTRNSTATQTVRKLINRAAELARFRRPLKFDFCQMTIEELERMVDAVIREDERDATSFRPIVAIGHSKDLVDFETVESFLNYLQRKEIPVSTFADVHDSCRC